MQMCRYSKGWIVACQGARTLRGYSWSYCFNDRSNGCNRNSIRIEAIPHFHAIESDLCDEARDVLISVKELNLQVARNGIKTVTS